MVDNVIHCFVGNLTDLPAVKEFRKSVKIWRNYRYNRVARFLTHIVIGLRLVRTKAIWNLASLFGIQCSSQYRPVHKQHYNPLTKMSGVNTTRACHVFVAVFKRKFLSCCCGCCWQSSSCCSVFPGCCPRSSTRLPRTCASSYQMLSQSELHSKSNNSK